MAITDLTADMIVKIRNANHAKKETVDIKRSRMLENICAILKKENFISNYKDMEDNKQGMIKVYLKYNKDASPAILGTKKVSKSGRRMYRGCTDLPKVFGGIGVAIISTSQGIMTVEEARAKKVGGEMICYVW